MKDYIILNSKQKIIAMYKHILRWPPEEIRKYNEYSWIIKTADSSWPFYKTHPYILGVQIPQEDDKNFWEEIVALTEEEYKEIVGV